MNKAREATIAVRIVAEPGENQNWLQSLDIAPRSQLYGLAPLQMGTFEVESLTSYVNRLAWAHGVRPRLFLTEMLVLHLHGAHDLQASVRRSGSLGRVRAMRSNGAGEMACEWANALNRLTERSDLRYLTIWPWANGLPNTGLLRKSPAWCPSCYHDWKDEGLPLYQPLYWMLQAVTICPHHQRQLEERCPQCQKRQSAIATQSRAGFCTQCMTWLGSPCEAEQRPDATQEEHDWQAWVSGVIKELIQASISSSPLAWECLAVGLSAGFTIRKEEKSQLIRSRLLRHSWINGTNLPSFMSLLELCYALNVSPLQLITTDPEILGEVIQIRQRSRPLQPPQHPARSSVDRKQARKAILRELTIRKRKPTLARSQLERRLGLPHGVLKRWFPRESASLAARYREYCAERSRRKVAQHCQEVRQVTIALHEQGMNPLPHRVAARLSHPSSMRTPEVRAMLHATRRELEYEI